MDTARPGGAERQSAGEHLVQNDAHCVDIAGTVDAGAAEAFGRHVHRSAQNRPLLGQFLVGFAAETGDLESEGTRKLQDKQADFIVANDVSRKDIGFGTDDNEVVVFRRERDPVRLPRQSKGLIAHRLLDLFAEALNEREAGFVSSGG